MSILIVIFSQPRTQYRLGKSGDLVIMDLVEELVDQFVDWTRNFVTLQRVLLLMNGQMTSRSGPSVEKRTHSVKDSGSELHDFYPFPQFRV